MPNEIEIAKLTPAPERVTTDILRTRIRHTPSRIRVRVTFADLRSTVAWASYGLHIVTNKGANAWPWLLALKGKAPLAIAGEMPRDAPCPLHRSIDYVNNVVVIGFARKCVRNPRWVRIGVYVRTSDLDDVYEYADDAARKGLRPDRWDLPTVSPRIYHASTGP